VNPNQTTLGIKGIGMFKIPGKIRPPSKTINNNTTTIQTILFAMINLLIFEVTVMITVPLFLIRIIPLITACKTLRGV
jgi:hypothetical protein